MAMSREGVMEVLNEQIRSSCSFAHLDKFYQEFQVWRLAVRKDVKNALSSKGKHKVFTLPTTPAASLRKRRRLSVISESPAGDIVQPSRKSLPRDSKNANAKNQPTLKERRSNRIKLTFKASDDEEEDSADNAKSHEAVDSSSQDSLNTHGETSQCLKSKSSFDCRMNGNVDQIHNEEENKRMTRNKSQRLNSFKRNTRSNVTAQNVEFEALESDDKLVLDASSSVTHASLSEPVNEDEQKENTRRKKGRSKNHSIISHNKRFTTSKRNTRSNVRTSKNTMYETLESQDQHPVDSSPSSGCLPEPIKEGEDGSHVEQEESTARRKGRSKNHSIIGAYKRLTTTKRKAQSNARTSQKINYETSEKLNEQSVGVSSTFSHPSISEGVMENIDRGNIIPEISNIPTSANKRNSQERFCKNLSISIKRIDETLQNSQYPVKITEEILRKCSENNLSVSSEGNPSKNSDSSGKKSPEKSSLGEKRKRDLSCSDIQRPSKKSHLHENDKENEGRVVAENSVQGRKTRSSLHQSKNHSLDASPKRNSRSPRSSKEISFSELPTKEPTSQTLNERASESEIFENSVSDINSEKEEEEDLKDNANDKADSGKGNSTESEVEGSEYFSVGSKIDTEDNSKGHTGREDANTCNLAADSVQRHSQRKKTDKASTKPNTPDTRGSRKGAHTALFSPYANEPVKNRVAAYEVLSSLAEEMEIPVTTKRVTRTKTRAMAAAAAAAAAAAEAGVLELKNSRVKTGPTHKTARASLWRTKKRLATTAKRNDASKENSFVSSAKNTGKIYNFTPQTGGKILADVNGLSSSQLNSSRKTPMTGPKNFMFTSANQSNKCTQKAGIILGNVDTFIKKNVKPVQDIEGKKLEEQKKREEKEREAQRRREELLRKQAEEKKKKRDEMRLRVQEKREAQEKEKQETQLRFGKEKNEKWNIIQQEREAKQKGNVLKKKLETERKAAEAKRKLEEAEVARLAKLKMEELHRKKELEEAEKEKQRRLQEEKEASLLREKIEQMRREKLAKVANEKFDIQKNISVPKPQVNEMMILDSSVTKTLDSTYTKPLDSTFTKTLDSTFTKPLDSTFTKPLDSTFTKPLDSTFTKPLNSSFKIQHSVLNIPAVNKIKNGNKKNNAYNLEDLPSGDSEDETEDKPKKVARWALSSEVLPSSQLDILMDRIANYFFCTPMDIDFSKIFPNKRSLKRTSSAVWRTPPRYSCLPKY